MSKYLEDIAKKYKLDTQPTKSTGQTGSVLSRVVKEYGLDGSAPSTGMSKSFTQDVVSPFKPQSFVPVRNVDVEARLKAATQEHQSKIRSLEQQHMSALRSTVPDMNTALNISKQKQALLKSPPTAQTVRQQMLADQGRQMVINSPAGSPISEQGWLQHVANTADPVTLHRFQTDPTFQVEQKQMLMPKMKHDQLVTDAKAHIDTKLSGVHNEDAKVMLQSLSDWWLQTKGTGNTLAGLVGVNKGGLAKGAEQFQQAGINREAIAAGDMTRQFLYDLTGVMPDMVGMVALGEGLAQMGVKKATKMGAGQIAKGLMKRETQAAAVKGLAQKLLVSPETVPLGLKVFAQEYQGNIGEGMDPKKAFFTSFINAYGQTLLEEGGINKLVGLEKQGKNAAINYLKGAFGEGFEEVTQDMWSSAVDKLVGSKDISLYSNDPNSQDSFINPQRMGYEFALGATAGGMVSGTMAGAQMGADIHRELTRPEVTYQTPEEIQAKQAEYARAQEGMKVEPQVPAEQAPVDETAPLRAEYSKGEIKNAVNKIQTEAFNTERKALIEASHNVETMDEWKFIQDKIDSLTPEQVVKAVQEGTAQPETMDLVKKAAFDVKPKAAEPTPVESPFAKLGEMKFEEPKAPDLGPTIDTSKMAPRLLSRMQSRVSELGDTANEVLNLAQQGTTAKQIANQLGIEVADAKAVMTLNGVPSTSSPLFEAWSASRDAAKETGTPPVIDQTPVIDEQVAQDRINNVPALAKVGATVSKDLTPGHKHVQELGKALGVNVVFYDGGKQHIQGLYSTKESRTIFIDSRSTERAEATMSVLGHETVHYLSEKHTDLYKTLREVVGENLTTEQVKRQLDKYGADPEYRSRLSTDRELLIEEMLADEGGSLFTDKTFWTNVQAKDPTKAQKLIKAIRDFINQVLGKRLPSGNVDVMTELQMKDFQKKFENAVAEITQRATVEEAKTTEAKPTEETKFKLTDNPFEEKSISYFKDYDAAYEQELRKKEWVSSIIQGTRAIQLNKKSSKEGNYVIVSPSTKGSAYQITYFVNNEPISDSQIENHEDLVDRLAEEGYGFVMDEMKYSIKSPELADKNLVALHNIWPSNLQKAIELGGLPVPSIAVTKEDVPFTDFGSITLVGNKDMIDPKNPENKVFDTDVYSRRVPTTYQKLDSKVMNSIRDKFRSVFDEVGQSVYSYLNFDEYRNNNIEDIKRSIIYRLNPVRLQFMREVKSKKITVPTKKLEISNRYISEKQIKEFLKSNPDFSVNHFYANEDLYKEKFSKMLMAAIGEQNYPENFAERLAQKAKDMYFGTDGKIKYNTLEEIKEDILKVKEGKSVVDEKALSEKLTMTPKVEKEYSDWIEETFNPLFGDSYFYDNGRKKAFNMDNIFSYMAGRVKGTEGFNYGAGSAKAMGAKKFKSVDEMHKDKHSITTELEVEQFKEQFQSKSSEVMKSLLEFHDGDTYRGFDDYWEAMASYLGGKTPSSSLSYAGFKSVPSNLVAEFKALADELDVAPVRYYEAKPQRIIKFKDFSAALVPKDVDKKIIELLKNNGVENVIKYDPSDDYGRTKALEKTKKYDDTRFKITAEHTTPHNFDKFDHSKMGTGEGAQVYGWGTYLSTSDEVRDYYRKTLSRGGLTYKGETVKIDSDNVYESSDKLTGPENNILEFVLSGVGEKGLDLKDAIKDAKAEYEDWDNRYTEMKNQGMDTPGLTSRHEAVKKILSQFDEVTSQIKEPVQTMKVDIDAEMEHMLDWDKPISEQSDYVQDKLKEAGVRLESNAEEQKLFFDWLKSEYPSFAKDWGIVNSSQQASVLSDYTDSTGRPAPMFTGLSNDRDSGSRLYKTMSSEKGSDKEASLYLNSIGITGIKYLDATSRRAGEGSYNYVVFDESKMTITEKYSIRKQALDEAFKDSKVRDENGELLELHHGTKSEFNNFIPSKGGEFGPGIYLSDNIDTAKWYSKYVAQGDLEPKVVSAFANITNPKYITKEEYVKLNENKTPKQIQALFIKQGYDGIIGTELNGYSKQYVAFEPTQIKSIEGADTVDLQNPDIRYKVTPEPTGTPSIGLSMEEANVSPDIKQFWNNFQRRVVNRIKPIEEADEKTGRLASNAALVSGTVEHIAKTALVDKMGNFVGKSLESVVKPFADNADFWMYMAQRHNIDRYREGVPVDPNMNEEQSRAYVEDAEKAHPEYKQWGDDVTQWIDDFMKEWSLKTGILSKDLYDEWREMYPSYFPTYREFTDLESQGNFGPGKRYINLPNVSKKATGSSRDITNPVGNIVQMMNKVVRTARYNEVGQTLLESVRNNPEKMAKYAEEIPANIGMFSKLDNVVSVWEDGKSKYLQINNKDLLESLNNLPRIINNNMGMRKISSIYKGLITHYNPFFAIRNIFRDIPTAYVYGSQDNPLFFLKNLVKAGYQFTTKTGGAAKYLALGGHGSGQFSADEAAGYAKLLQPSAAGNPLVKAAKKGLGAIEFFNSLTEQSPRISEFNHVLDKTGDVQKALHAAQNVTVNFARGGDVTKQIEPFVPYLNASVQGIDKFVQSFRFDKDPKGAMKRMVKSGIAITLPQIVSYILCAADEKDKYDSLDQRTKDTAFVFPKGDGTYWKIPKSRELGVLFGSLFERGLSGYGYKGVGGTFATNFLPVNPFTNNMAAAFIFNLPSNKDFAGRPIVPMNLKGKVEPFAEYDANTSEIAKEIGNRTNLSPMQIDYILKSYTGVIGSILIPATTKRSGAGTALERLTVGAFTADPAFSSQATTDFYDRLDKLEKSKNTKNLVEKIPSKVRTPEERLYSVNLKMSTTIGKANKYMKTLKTDDPKIQQLKNVINKYTTKATKTNNPADVLRLNNMMGAELYKAGVR